MPAYNYHCSQCQNTFEVRKRMSELDTATSCPDCGSVATDRLISAVAIFSGAEGGQHRALAGMSACGGCSVAGSGCSGCSSR